MSLWQRVALAAELTEPGRVRQALASGQLARDVTGWRAQLEARRMWAQSRDDEAGPVLFGRGARLAPRPHVAIVGARATDPYGLALSRQIALDVIALGGVVVSGGAEGCDGAAHRAALELGGTSVVVLGGGHDHPYPACHRDLFEAIATSGGTLLSSYWPEVRPRGYRFLRRNTVIASLSDAVVVVRAALRSGALSTARAARKLGVPVFAVPGDVGQQLSAGPHQLLADGALPLVGSSGLRSLMGTNRVVDRWPVASNGAGPPWSEGPVEAFGQSLSETAELILMTLGDNPGLDLDALVMRTECPVDSVASALLDLELGALVARLPGERYATTGCDGGVGPTGSSDERTGQ